MNKEETKEKRLKLHYQKIDNNLKLLNETFELSKYEYVYKIIKGRLRYLTKLIEYSKDKRINDYSTIHNNYYFYASYRYLAKRYKGHTSTWSRNINIFASLGFINKINIEGLKIANNKLLEKSYKYRQVKAKSLGLNTEKIKTINYYTIPLFDYDLLNRANNIAKIMIDNNFKANEFNKTYLIRLFGQEFADSIYDDRRIETKDNNYVKNCIEEYILKDIKKNGFTTKQNILENANINTNQVLESQLYKSKKRENILCREFNKSINEILEIHCLEYKKANRELKNKFNLDTYKFIIYKA